MPEIQQTRFYFLSFLKRTLSLFLCAALLPLTPPAEASSIPESSAMTAGLAVPDSLGRVDEFVPGNSGRTVYVIQDAHDSLEAQENIAAMIHYLVDSQGVREVFEEGYEGAVPTDLYFKGIEDPELRRRVSYYLMDKLRIGGAEYAHINREKDFELLGADNVRLHFENVQAYRDNLRGQQRAQEDIQRLESALRRLADQVFDSDLKEWLKLKERYESGSLSFLDYLSRIAALSGPDGLDAEKFPLLERLIRSTRTLEDEQMLAKAGARSFFAELAGLERFLGEQHLKERDDLALFDMIRSVRLLKRLSLLTVSAAEYEALRDFAAGFDTKAAAGFIAQKTGTTVVLQRDWEDLMKPAFRFYEAARARDQAVHTALESLSRGQSILVFGGFHLDAVKHILTARGDSFYVISPRISGTSSRHEAYYHELMSDGFDRLSLPGFLRTAAVPPRFYEYGVINPGGPSMLAALIERVAEAAAEAKEDFSPDLVTEMDLLMRLSAGSADRGPDIPLRVQRSELRIHDAGEDPSVLLSAVQNSLDGNVLIPDAVKQFGLEALLRRIHERIDFVRESLSEHDYTTALRTVESILEELPAQSVLRPARGALENLRDSLISRRSELRDEKMMEPVEIHAFRLARERKPVVLPYFARHHGVSRDDAVKALEQAGFEFYSPSEAGDQYVYPLTPELEKRLLQANPYTGEDPARTQPLEAVGEALLDVNQLLDQIQPDDPDHPVILSPSPAELKEEGIFHFRDRTVHGLNNIATFLLLSPRSVSYYTLRNTVDDLWASIKVLDDLTAVSPKDYRRISPSIRDVVYTHNAATRIGAAAVKSAEEGQFLPAHTQEIRDLRARLEQIYGMAARLLNEREREFLTEAAREKNTPSQNWGGIEGVSFSEIDPVLAEKLSAYDLDLLRKILSGSREDVRNLVKQNPQRVYFKSEDGGFVTEGRTVYLRLEEPVEVTIRGASHRLTQLRIKGLVTEGGDSGAPVYFGQGRVERRIVPAADGTLNSIENPLSPRGGLRAADARTEYEVMKGSLKASGYEADYPAAWGVYESRLFMGEATGFVIAGFEGEDVRLTSAYGMTDEDRVIAYAPVQSRDLMTLDEGSEMVLYRMMGRALRSYHDAGYYHGFPHLGNMGIRRTRGEIAVIFRDLNTTVTRSSEMPRTQETAYRFIDAADVIVRLQNFGRGDLIDHFLSGYFKMLPQSSEAFKRMVSAAKDPHFLLEFLRLDDTLPESVELDDGTLVNIRERHPPVASLKVEAEHPAFGTLWSNLESVTAARSELRTEDELKDFLHEHVFLRRFGHYEILADYRYEDFEAIDRETLALLPRAAAAPRPFRMVLLNGYYGPKAEGRKHPQLVILGHENGTWKAMGLATLQDAETFLDGLGDPGIFADGETLDKSFYVTRTDIFYDYQGEALMQRAATALLLKGAVKKWIPSATQLYPSRRMYERMKSDLRLNLQGRQRTRLVTAARSELRADIPLAEVWKKSTPQEKEKMLSKESAIQASTREDYTDWLMYVLLDPDFTYRRRVVELNNWDPGLRLDPAVLLEHLSKPWISLETYGSPPMPENAAFDETQAIRNKRMALLILLTERVAEYLSGRFPAASVEMKLYIEEIQERIRKSIEEDLASQPEEEARYDRLKKTVDELGDFALGARRPMSFLEVFLLESLRYDSKTSDLRARDTYGWFHDDYFLSFVYSLGSPELHRLLDSLMERVIDERRKREQSEAAVTRPQDLTAVSRSGHRMGLQADRRSELRQDEVFRDVRRILEQTSSQPGVIFISYDEIRGDQNSVRDSLLALGARVRSDRPTKILVYGVDASDLMNPEIRELRDAAGIQTFQEDLETVYRRVALSEEAGKDRASYFVHWATKAEKLRHPPGDILLFLGTVPGDLAAALLLARSGGELPGVTKGREGFYSVTENFLREELERYQASLVIGRSA